MPPSSDFDQRKDSLKRSTHSSEGSSTFSGHTSLASLSYLQDESYPDREEMGRRWVNSRRNNNKSINNSPRSPRRSTSLANAANRDSLVSIGDLWDECDADPLGHSAVENAEQPIDEETGDSFADLKDFVDARVDTFARNVDYAQETAEQFTTFVGETLLGVVPSYKLKATE